LIQRKFEDIQAARGRGGFKALKTLGIVRQGGDRWGRLLSRGYGADKLGYGVEGLI